MNTLEIESEILIKIQKFPFQLNFDKNIKVSI